MAISEIELASCAEVDAAAAAGWTTLAPMIPRPAAVALLRNRRRSAGFSALRSIRSCTYLFPNIFVPPGLTGFRRTHDRWPIPEHLVPLVSLDSVGPG